MQLEAVDLLVIGGGINGVGVAADAAGRGLTVTLCEKDDLAAHTSSSSSKLIHGGLRYLEQGEFKLVRAALNEREILMKIAPHLIHPLEFILPYDSHLRSRFLIRLGLLLYDYLGSRKTLKKSQGVKLSQSTRGKVLKARFNYGFSYTDCWTDDSRLVITNAKLARNKGATILTRTEVVSATRTKDFWLVKIKYKKTNKTSTLKAKAIVNAAGAWVPTILETVAEVNAKSQIKMVKGSHLVLPKLYEGKFAYVLQNKDKRVIFVIPYKNNYSLVGTTDVLFTKDPNRVEVSQDEITYLLKGVNYYFANTLQQKDIVWSYSGVRALYDDRHATASEITRESHLELNVENNYAPILSIFGGKLTTYRVLSEKVLTQLAPFFPEMKGAWTEKACLPGGELGAPSFIDFVERVKRQYANFPVSMVERMAKAYGAEIQAILGNETHLDSLGKQFGANFYEKEVEYLIKHEWAQTTEDLLWRRTKLGLEFDQDKVKILTNYLAEKFYQS